MKKSPLFAGLLALAISMVFARAETTGLRTSGRSTSDGDDDGGRASIVVTTIRITQTKSVWAECAYTVDGVRITEQGVCCWIKPAPTVEQKKTFSSKSAGNPKNVMMTGLTPKTMYYVRAYAKSGGHVFYGNELNFTTEAADPNGNAGRKVESKPSGSK